MEKMQCANKECKLHRENRGGKFKFLRGEWYCEQCAGFVGLANPGKNLWDMTTTHFNGEPIKVTSGAHMDQLCKQFGVSNHAREHYERNW